MLKHVVLFAFREDAPGEEVAWVLGEIPKLVGAIPGLQDCVVGPKEAADGVGQSFTHGFVMTFDSADGPAQMHLNPAHQRIVERFVPIIDLEGSLVFDFLEIV